MICRGGSKYLYFQIVLTTFDFTTFKNRHDFQNFTTFTTFGTFEQSLAPCAVDFLKKRAQYLTSFWTSFEIPYFPCKYMVFYGISPDPIQARLRGVSRFRYGYTSPPLKPLKSGTSAPRGQQKKPAATWATGAKQPRSDQIRA